MYYNEETGPEDGTHMPKQVVLDSSSTCWKLCCVGSNIIYIIYVKEAVYE
jgi:hypothetical protein